MNSTKKQKILSQLSPAMSTFLLAMKKQGEERNIPNISWDTADYLREALRKRDIFEILEIGPANGFSTMILNIGSPQAHISSIECSRHAFEELRHNMRVFSSIKNEELNPACRQAGMKNDGYIFTPAHFGPKITSTTNQEEIGHFSLYYADARELLPLFSTGGVEIQCINPRSFITEVPKKKFECIFIDGAFRMTREFFDLSRPLLADNGIMILDDAIKYRWKMEGFHEYLEEQGIAYELVQTDEDDGVMVIDFGNNSQPSA